MAGHNLLASLDLNTQYIKIDINNPKLKLKPVKTRLEFNFPLQKKRKYCLVFNDVGLIVLKENWIEWYRLLIRKVWMCLDIKDLEFSLRELIQFSWELFLFATVDFIDTFPKEPSLNVTITKLNSFIPQNVLHSSCLWSLKRQFVHPLPNPSVQPAQQGLSLGLHCIPLLLWCHCNL